MEMTTKIILLTFIVTLLTLIMTTTIDYSKRWKIVFATIFCCITSFGIQNIIAPLMCRQQLHLWTFDDYYNQDNWKIFFNEVFLIGFVWTFISAIIFYIGLPLITSNIHQKIKKYFSGKFNTCPKLFYEILKRRERYNKYYHKIILIKPSQLKIYDKSNDKELEYDLNISNINIAFYIHAFISILIFNPPYQWFFLSIIIFLLMRILFAKPIMQSIADRLNKETEENKT